MYIESIRDNNKCVGCGNCENICPTEAVKMISNKEGFLVPCIEYEKCVNCKKCEKVCPNEQLKYREMAQLPDAYLVKAKVEDILKKVASGGICTLLSEYFIMKKNGFVCGAVYDEEFNVVHILTNKIEDVKRMSQSKYVQSKLGDCFVNIEKKLLEEKYVLFIGTTCQIYALKKYLMKSYSTLYCIDLICYGVPSPKAQQEYVKWQKKNGTVKNMNNRYKKLYPHSYVKYFLCEFSNGKTVLRRYSDDPMAQAFFSHLSVRQSCFECSFKTIHRISDITTGDFWFSEFFGFGEDLLGTSLCFIQSSKGAELLNFIQERIEKKQIDSNTAVILNGGMMYSSCVGGKNREKFFMGLGEKSFRQLVIECDEKNRKKRIKNTIREFLAPVLRFTRYYNRQLEKSAKQRMKRVIPENKKGLMFYEDE